MVTWIQCLPRRVQGGFIWTLGTEEKKRGYSEERKRCFSFIWLLVWFCTYVCGVHKLIPVCYFFFSSFLPLSQVIFQGIPTITQLFYSNLTSSNNCEGECRVGWKFGYLLLELSILQPWHFCIITRVGRSWNIFQISCFSADDRIDIHYQWFRNKKTHNFSSVCLWGC